MFFMSKEKTILNHLWNGTRRERKAQRGIDLNAKPTDNSAFKTLKDYSGFSTC